MTATHINQIEFRPGQFVEKYALANGLKVIFFQDSSAPIFAYHTWLGVGSRNERDGITGIAHLFEHLMFKGTKNMKDGEFAKTIEEHGGQLNAATSMDFTFYRESLPKECFDMIPKIEADRLQNMILTDDQVNSEREVVANERRMRVDNNPSGTMYESLFKTSFKLHPYHWPVIGWMKDIETISAKDCLAFHGTYYGPNNACVVVVGDVDREETLKTIEAAYGSIPASNLPQESLPVEPDQTVERRIDLNLPITGEKLLMGYRIPDAFHEDMPALDVLNSIVFDGKSSRLYRKLVAEAQICSNVSGGAHVLRYPGLYIINTSMQKDYEAVEAEQYIYKEFDVLASEDVSDRELEKAVNRLEAGYWRNFRTVDQKAQGLGFYETVMNDYRLLFEEVPKYQSVKKDDLRRVAKRYLRPERRTVITARPEDK